MGGKHIILSAFSILFLIGATVYAIDTIRTYIPETTATGQNPYLGQNITILSWATLIDKDNDGVLLWDFFSGYYYDAALWVFSFDTLSDKVRISSNNHSCSWHTTTHIWSKLEGYSWNANFWAMDFSNVYICTPQDENSNSDSYIGWEAYNQLVGFQNFSEIPFDAYVDRSSSHASDARYTKVDGVVSSQNYSDIDAESQDEVRVVWNITKSSLKKQVLQNVYKSIKNTGLNNGAWSISSTSLWSIVWNNSLGGKLLQNNSVLYFSDISNPNINVNISWNNNIEWNKTLVVEGGNIYITGNIRNTDNDNAILGLIAVRKDGQGWNIYIDPSVTDIHANMYADRSILSYNGIELDGDIPDSALSNQLYIYGSIFSENTLWWADDTPLECPFYINTTCSKTLAKKYDLNYLRRYILVTEILNGVPTWEMFPNNSGAESYMRDNSNNNTEVQKPWYRRYPFVIEYNSNIQQNPPPFF